jgi:hypothetical protein
MGLGNQDTTPPTIYNGIRTNEAILGRPLPILIGQQRISWKLFWWGAFNSWQPQNGGKGLSKGGNTYVYSASVVGGLCMGPCSALLGVWSNNGKFVTISFSENYVVGGSLIYTPAQAAHFQGDLGVGAQIAYSVTTNDYGSPGSATQSGTQQSRLEYTTNPSPGPGQYTIDNGNYSAGPFVLSAVDGDGNYTGIITGGDNNAYVGLNFSTTGFTNAANNVVGVQCTASTATTITLAVGAVTIAESAVGSAAVLYPQYVFNAAQTGQTVVITYVTYRYHIDENELDVVPLTSPYQITVQFQSGFDGDTGVFYYPSGIALRAVSGTPTATGTYNPNGGNYLFAPGDAGIGVVITYIYNDPNYDPNDPTGKLNLTFSGGGLGQAVWSYLLGKFPNAAIGYSEIAWVASAGLYLGFSAVLPQMSFEVIGAYAFGNGVGDANPADAIYGLLTNPQYKYNFPAANIDTSLLGLLTVEGSVTSGTFTDGEQVVQASTSATATLTEIQPVSNSMKLGPITGGIADATHTWVGQSSGAVYTPTSLPLDSSAKAQWSANDFFISAILDSQTSLMDTISQWCEAGQVYISWDEGLLKFIPLVDTTSVGNGVVYYPPTQPVIDLDDNDFIQEPNKDPITIEQIPWQSRWNRVSVRWSVRTNDYNEDVLQIQDEGAIQQQIGGIPIGLQSESARGYQFICNENSAQFAANMRLQRFSAIYTTYKFKLKYNIGCFLSPGDIITVTDGLLNTLGTMFGRTPVRITKMTDDPVGGISIEAENFPWSVGTALLYNKQAQLPSNTNDGPQEDPGNTTALIFEVTNQAAQFKGPTIYIFANGGVNWGGFQAWVSYDGVDYSFFGQFTDQGRIGVTTADLPAHADPDTVDTLTVNMQQSGAQLQSVSTLAWNAYVSLCALITPNVASSTQMVAGNGLSIGSGGGGGSPGSQGPLRCTIAIQTVGDYAFGIAWLNPTDVTGTGSYSDVTLPDQLSFGPFTISSVSLLPGSSDLWLYNGTIAGGANNGLQPTASAIASGFSHSGNDGTFSVFGTASTYIEVLNPSGVVDTGGSVTIKTPGASQQILATGFGFNVPTAGIGPIVGLTVSFSSYRTLTGGGWFIQFQLNYKGSRLGGPISTNYSATSPTTFTIGTLDSLSGDGNPNNSWQLTAGSLTADIVNDPSFGVTVIAINASGVATPIDIFLNDIQMELAWAAGGTGTAWINPDNVNSNSAFATAVLGSSEQTQYLFAFNLNFNLPFGFTPEGIVVTLNGKTSSSNTASIAAVLVSGQTQIGTPKSAVFGPGLGLITFGYNEDLWGADDNFWTIYNLNEQGQNGFGVMFLVTGDTGDTISLNNVQVTIYGSGVQALELIAYENADLTGPNTYDLTTLHRGILGSFPVDHPAGATFARLDQATIIYEVPSQYLGSIIYFKFLSFNAYGNQLQSLAQVQAFSLLIEGNGPGAIDVKTGKLLTGTPNYTVPQIEAGMLALYGPFGIQNIPSNFGLFGPPDRSSGLPVWQDVSTGAGGGINDVYIYLPPVAGTYGTLQELYYTVFVRQVTLPAGLVGSVGGCRVAPAANVQVSIYQNGVLIGTINIAASSLVATFTFTNAITWDGATDSFQLVAPTVVDQDFAGFWVAFEGSRAN